MKQRNHAKKSFQNSHLTKLLVFLVFILTSLGVNAAPGELLSTISNPDPFPDDRFGGAVTSTPDGKIIVGAPGDYVGGRNESGRVFIYDQATGQLLSTLYSPDPRYTNRFGASVLVTASNQLIVGTYSIENQIYVFDQQTEQLLLTIPHPDPEFHVNDIFGRSLATTPSGKIVAGTSPWTNIGPSGRAYIFDGQSGEFLLTLTSPIPEIADYFGSAVTSMPGGRIAVGAYGANDELGRVFVFDEHNGELLLTLENPNPDFVGFGFSLVGTSSGKLVVSAIDETYAIGRVYIFDSQSGQLLHTLISPNKGGTGDAFGHSIASSPSGEIVVGAYSNDALVPKTSISQTNSGSIYIYDEETGQLLLTRDNPTPQRNDHFGVAVAVTHTGQILVGAQHDDTRNTGGGKVYIYEGLTPPNSAPFANAGSDQSPEVGSLVTLDGSRSSDVDGDQLTYRWELTATPLGSNATLSNPTSVHPSFVVDVPGLYQAELIVNDGELDSLPDTVSIDTANVPPNANAGSDQSVYVNEVVTLNGSQSSDADGDLLTYSWVLTTPSGSASVLSDSSTVNPTFTVDVPGSYVASLIVNDGTVDSSPSSATITTINAVPLANAGEDQAVYVGDLVTLDGSKSNDLDGDPLTYNWSFTLLPSGSTAVLNDSDSVNPTFTVDVPGLYIVSVIVDDGKASSSPDTVSISTINVAPVADAGVDQAVFVNDLVFLDGSQSTDADGDTLTYQWSFSSAPLGSMAVLNDTSAVRPTFVVDKAGVYTLTLVVNDGTLNSAPSSVSISTINVAPVANAGPNQSGFVGDVIGLDGSQSSDADGDALTYSWSFTSLPVGSTASLSDSTAVNPTFVADVAGIYGLNLVVNDGTVNSAPSTISVSIVTLESAVITELQELITDINVLDPGIFKNSNQAKALTNKINTLIVSIESGDISEAIAKLETDIIRKTDGCIFGNNPDNNDWIRDCSTQSVIYLEILNAIELLNSL